MTYLIPKPCSIFCTDLCPFVQQRHPQRPLRSLSVQKLLPPHAMLTLRSSSLVLLIMMMTPLLMSTSARPDTTTESQWTIDHPKTSAAESTVDPGQGELLATGSDDDDDDKSNRTVKDDQTSPNLSIFRCWSEDSSDAPTDTKVPVRISGKGEILRIPLGDRINITCSPVEKIEKTPCFTPEEFPILPKSPDPVPKRSICVSETVTETASTNTSETCLRIFYCLEKDEPSDCEFLSLRRGLAVVSSLCLVITLLLHVFCPSLRTNRLHTNNMISMIVSQFVALVGLQIILEVRSDDINETLCKTLGE